MTFLSRIHFQSWQSYAVIIAIIVFGFAMAFTAWHILTHERLAIDSYQAKSTHLVETEEHFERLKKLLLIYLSEENESVTSHELAEAFTTFQDHMLSYAQRFPQRHSGTQKQSFHTRKFLQLQTDVMALASYLEQTAEQPRTEGQVSLEALESLERIDQSLNRFIDAHIGHELSYLDPESYYERNWQVFLSISLMGLSAFLMILLLVKKNEELEEAEKHRQQVSNEAELRMMAMEVATDGIVIIDPDDHIIYMNYAFADLHGITPDQISNYIGGSVYELYTEKGQRNVREEVMPHVKTHGYWTGDSPILKKNGETTNIEMTLTMLPSGQGLIGTAKDISERLLAETEKEDLKEQIFHAQKMEAIGRLAGGIAHDFNNILGAIAGYAEFLVEDLKNDKKLKSFAENILSASDKGRGLIDQMLAFSRRKQTAKQPHNLISAMQETVGMLSASIPKTIHVGVETVLDNMNAATIYANPAQIVQVLMNLCVNAIDAMDPEHGELSLRIERTMPDPDMFEHMLVDELPEPDETPLIRIHDMEVGHSVLELGVLQKGLTYYQLSVVDNGSGMSRSILEHIFEPFFTTKSQEKGTGLGMANVHGVVISHHGAMIIDSVLQEGTTFELYFPAYEDEVTQETEVDQDENRDGKIDEGHVLLIDDEDQVRMMLETSLERGGFTYRSFPSAMEALKYLRDDGKEEVFDLILTDQNMPNMTGLEFVDQIRIDRSDTPVVLISGYSHEKLQGIEEEYDSIKATLRKPVRLQILLETLQNVIANSHAATRDK